MDITNNTHSKYDILWRFILGVALNNWINKVNI